MDSTRRPSKKVLVVALILASFSSFCLYRWRRYDEVEWIFVDGTFQAEDPSRTDASTWEESSDREKESKRWPKTASNAIESDLEAVRWIADGPVADRDEPRKVDGTEDETSFPREPSAEDDRSHQAEISSNPKKRFLMFFSGHQGSSALMEAVGQIDGVYVPGFEPLDNPSGPTMESMLSEDQKMAFIEAVMNMPQHEADFDAWREKMLPNKYIRVDRSSIQSYEQIANSTVAGFKMRPYVLEGDSLPAMISLDPEKVRSLLEKYQVNIVVSWRSNILKSALSWYRARVLGKRQCFRHNDELCQENDINARTASEINIQDFDKWVKYVEKTNDELIKSISYYRRPTLMINYEDFEVHPSKSVAQLLEFIGVPEAERTEEKIDAALAEISFHKVGSNSWHDMISNFKEFCEHFQQTPYWPNLGMESCESAIKYEQEPATGLQVQKDFTQNMDLIPGSRYCLVKDVVASGWIGMDGEYDPHLGPCDIRIAKARSLSLERARSGEGKIFFKHMHKSGGSTLCNIARQNVRAEKAPIPGGSDGWDTNCVPQSAFVNTGPGVPTIESEKEGAWYGGVCYASHLSVAAQRALNITHKELDFIASEGPMPDTLALELPVAWITMLRDPLDRTLSSYRWWEFLAQRFKDKPKVRTALCGAYEAPPVGATLQEWLRVYPDNWMVRTLCGRSVLMDSTVTITEEHLKAAKARLNQFSIVMVLEEMENSMSLLASSLGWKNVDARALQSNVMSNTSAREELASQPDLLHVLQAKNEMDLKLYRYGLELFHRQLKFSIHR